MINNDKMTIEDAILVLKDRNNNIDHATSYVGVDWTKVYNFAIDAMGKQATKQVVTDGFIHTVKCPTCGEIYRKDDNRTNYCSNCGQRLRWSE